MFAGASEYRRSLVYITRPAIAGPRHDKGIAPNMISVFRPESDNISRHRTTTCCWAAYRALSPLPAIPPCTWFMVDLLSLLSFPAGTFPFQMPH